MVIQQRASSPAERLDRDARPAEAGRALGEETAGGGVSLGGPCSCGAPPPLARQGMLGGQRLLGNRAMQRWLDRHIARSVALTPGAAPRQTVQRKKENEQALADIQGFAMFALLPALAALPPAVRADEEAGGFVGGPRLVTAMRAVAAKGTSWTAFVAARNGELASLPNDQIADIISFLGAPKDAHYYKADQFGGMFDGGVDPAGGGVTLYFRVRFVVEGARFGAASAGTKEWEKETQAGLEKFKADFKRVVEETWSGKGLIKPACPVGPIKSLPTKVVVAVVESGEHTLFHILNDVPGGKPTPSRAKAA